MLNEREEQVQMQLTLSWNAQANSSRVKEEISIITA